MISGLVPPPLRGIAVVYQDTTLIVADKPAGMLAVPGRGADKQDCCAARIQQEFPDALIVHRLDMATSGLIVFARGAAMQRKLSRMFRERAVHKRYIARVSGKMKQAQGEIALPLIADWPNRPKQKVDEDTGKPALTRYRVLGFDGEVSRVELEPVTGRTHQLRVHLAAIGHPILGDMLYHGPAAERLMLHACELSFVHPVSGEKLELRSMPPF